MWQQPRVPAAPLCSFGRRLNVRVVTGEGIAAGQTVIDHLVEHLAPNTDVVLDALRERFMELLLETHAN